MKIYTNYIPSLFFQKIADLHVPPGTNVDMIVERVANQIAKVVIHEAEHGRRWAQEFYTNKQRLDQMQRSQEESYAEQAAERASLKVDLDEGILGDSQEEKIITNHELLVKAINISNLKNSFYIPPDLVRDVPLGGHWGQFEAIQTPDGQVKQAPASPHVAWNEKDRKLDIDVTSIVNSYDKSLQGLKPTYPATFQDDGTEPDLPGVSRQPPVRSPEQGQQGRTAVPSRSAVPSR